MIEYKRAYEQTKNLSVLLAEDHAPLRKELQEVLEDLFQTVMVASDGNEALCLFQESLQDNQSNIDLLISDIQMPNMNGIELTRHIRKLHETLPIIILSAHTDSEYLLDFIDMGISKFVTKPIENNSLLDALETVSQKIHLLRPTSNTESMIHLGEGYYWHHANSVLYNNDKEISLTKHEILLFGLLVSKRGTICSSQYIIDYFDTHDTQINKRNIRNAIFKLRQKVKTNAIQSIYGLGYKLIETSKLV